MDYDDNTEQYSEDAIDEDGYWYTAGELIYYRLRKRMDRRFSEQLRLHNFMLAVRVKPIIDSMRASLGTPESEPYPEWIRQALGDE